MSGKIIFGAVYTRTNDGPLAKAFIENEFSDVLNICNELSHRLTNDVSLLEHEDGYQFLVVATVGGLTYIAVSAHHQNTDLKTLRYFLDNVRSKFEKAYGAQINAEGASDRLVGRGYEEFNRVIKEEGRIAMSSNPRQQTEQLVDHVKDVMIQNMEKVLERHTKIEVIMEDAMQLKHQSMKFHKDAKSAKHRMCWKNYRCWIFILLAMLAVLFIILLVACEPSFKRCK